MLQLRGFCSLTEKNGSSSTLKRQRYFNTKNGTEGSFVNPLYWIQEDWKTLNYAHTAAQLSHQYHCERSLCRFSRPQTKLPPFHLGRPLLWRQTLHQSFSQTAPHPVQRHFTYLKPKTVSTTCDWRKNISKIFHKFCKFSAVTKCST